MVRNLVAHLHGDGRLDLEFDRLAGPSGGPDRRGLPLDVGADAKVMIAGEFTQVCRRPWRLQVSGSAVPHSPRQVGEEAVGVQADEVILLAKWARLW